MAATARMTSGAVAKAAGVNVETLRFYERSGLLSSPPRTGSGYRQYPPDAVDRVRFVKHVQRLGFTLGEAAELLALQFEAAPPCAEIERRAVAKATEIERKIASLVAMRDGLLALMARCGTECASSCTVLLEPAAPASASACEQTLTVSANGTTACGPCAGNGGS